MKKILGGIVLLVVLIAAVASPICANGVCNTFLGKVDDIADETTEVSFTSGSIICRAEVKAGQDLFNFYKDGCDSCYCVEGINTHVVKVWETFERDCLPKCKDMSHVNLYGNPTAVSFTNFTAKASPRIVVLLGFISVLIVLSLVLLVVKGGK